ncbi:hypothetical protein [Jeotgalibacillus aurantiacus]|uniref:hypothetical protein n=1 Tax=Jeotgalibacillus aurantiacus TaxID=2763266 RepID=UPI001D0ADEF7|nr:hypothetical protein [Jeotgalibacillus aurantiacus]
MSEKQNGLPLEWPSQSSFTTEDKKAVWNKIKRPKKKKKPVLFPTLLTGAVAAVFLMVSVQLIPEEPVERQAAVEEPTSSELLKEIQLLSSGDEINGWQVEVQHSAARISKWTFTGEQIMSGEVYISGSASSVQYTPDQDSKKKLPFTSAGEMVFVFDDHFKKQYMTENPIERNTGEWMVYGIEVIQISGKLSTITLKTLNDEGSFIEGKEVIDGFDADPDVFRIPVDENFNVSLTEDQLNSYRLFSQTGDGKALMGLDPYTIFLLYLYADEQKDYKTQYALFNHESDEFIAFETFEEYESAKGSDGADRLHVFKKNEIKQIIEGQNAYIAVDHQNPEEQAFFGLHLDHEGIWRVNWLPMQ